MNDNSKERYVKREGNDTLSCSCRLFEMERIICSHIIKLLKDTLNIKEIPDQYILKRWTKHARAERVQDMHGYEIQADPKLQQTCRYIFLCYAFTKIASRASESERAYNLVNEHASKFSKLVEDILCSEMDDNVNEKDHELPFEELRSNTNKECVQDVDIVKATRLKRRPWIEKNIK